jgi:transcriptional regulator with XRE-family HTH domain
MGTQCTRRMTRATRDVAIAREQARSAARRLGLGTREARLSVGLTQSEVAHRVGVSQVAISRLERGLGARASLELWMSTAAGVGRRFAAFLEAMPGADLPRDHEHLKRQRLVIETARRGGWRPTVEVAIDPLAARSRSIDVVLTRRATNEIVVVEVWDWLFDVGDAIRSSDAKAATVRRRISGQAGAPSVTELWVLRGTHRNRELVRDFASIFDVRFPSPSAAWLRALGDEHVRAPTTAGLVWTDIRGDRLMARRQGGKRDGPTH